MWDRLLPVVVAAVAVFAVVRFASVRSRRRRFESVSNAWLEARPAGRVDALRPFLAPDRLGNRDAAAWYLLGCAHLREGGFAAAARAFGVAHHADYRIESAALLTFACLKAATADRSGILEQIIETWNEMCRPAVAEARQERLLLDCLESTTRDLPGLSPIGRLAWLVVGPDQQSSIERALQEGGRQWTEVVRSYQNRPADALGDTLGD